MERVAGVSVDDRCGRAVVDMKLNELKAALAKHPEQRLRFVLPDGRMVPAHAHITEVARVDKRFVDCGGTLRNDSVCRLQTWTAQDFHHRLSAGKLLDILNKAAAFLPGGDVEVDVEHELEFVSQFPLENVEVDGPELRLNLSTRHTACLASDQCGVPAAMLPVRFKPLPGWR
jgi:hypothetical protein